MKKRQMSKKIIACVMLFVLLITALPVQAATKTVKADTTIKKEVSKVIKTNKITSSTSKSVALKKVFTYMTTKNRYKYSRAPLGFKPNVQKNWERDFAKQLLKNKRGSCYHYAAAYAYLAKKISKYPVRIGYGQAKVFSDKWQAHAWTEIKIGKTWYIYDANAQQFSKKRVGKWYQQKRTSMTKIYNLKTAKYTYVEI